MRAKAGGAAAEAAPPAFAYALSVMAAAGQAWVQLPHSRQASGFCAVATPPLAANTPVGHTCRQAPQPPQRPEATTTRAVAPLAAEAFPPLALLPLTSPPLPLPTPECREPDPWP